MRGFTSYLFMHEKVTRNLPVYAGVYPPTVTSTPNTPQVAPCTRGFADNDPKPPPKSRNSDMKNRTVVVRMLNSDQIPNVTEHAKNLDTLVFEVHETESGEYHSIKDAGKYYRNGYTNHVFPSPLFRKLRLNRIRLQISNLASHTSHPPKTRRLRSAPTTHFY